MADLSVRIGALKLKNPVMVASGTFGYAEEFKGLCDLKKLGAIVTKTITIRPRQGNPVPRTCETPSGLINSIGLENPGIEGFLSEKLPVVRQFGVPVIVSIASEEDPDEFAVLAKRLDRVPGVSALELNISCPNLKKKRLVAQDARSTAAVVKTVRRVTGKTLIVKLSPNVTDIAEIALAAQNAGSDALALINTVQAMAIDVKTRTPRIAMGIGGLSGPAVRPIAVRMVWEVYNKVGIPIVGMGGIMDTNSALEFFIAGATAVSIGTANFIEPGIANEIITGIKKYLTDNKISSIQEFTGMMACKT
ncbi:MAG TPA: dihydroorotate dehydrogenase [Candidatus Omnitrophota bacterium]|nr:dihydroorotate dehydrogenase [Candidatus Omnitrophota bacterium]HQQ05772.1 dihydroorotate dehydrogenase [Candidatus Omnitrophota bacterium]